MLQERRYVNIVQSWNVTANQNRKALAMSSGAAKVKDLAEGNKVFIFAKNDGDSVRNTIGAHWLRCAPLSSVETVPREPVATHPHRHQRKHESHVAQSRLSRKFDQAQRLLLLA